MTSSPVDPQFGLLEKGDLHVHLNGLVSIELMKTLIEEEQIPIPPGVRIPEDLYQTRPTSLPEYLKAWEILRLVPTQRTHLKLMIDSAFLRLKNDNIRFAEIRSSILYVALNNSVTVDVALGWMLEDMDEAGEKYGVRYGLIMSVPRGTYTNDHLNALLRGYLKLGKPSQIIGLDLSGNEDFAVPDFIAAQYARAKSEYGLHITIHAGETGNPANILSAIRDYKAERIGHGTSALKDPRVVDALVTGNICLEVCPVSNRLTGAVKEGVAHPMTGFRAAGIPFVLCSDNPNIHRKTLSDDYAEFLKETGDADHMSRMYSLQKQYAFLPSI